MNEATFTCAVMIHTRLASPWSSPLRSRTYVVLTPMDSYLKLRDGEKHPAVLLTTGINDKRVDPWHSAMMTARLQAASASGKPVMLRVDYDAGHGWVRPRNSPIGCRPTRTRPCSSSWSEHGLPRRRRTRT